MARYRPANFRLAVSLTGVHSKTAPKVTPTKGGGRTALRVDDFPWKESITDKVVGAGNHLQECSFYDTFTGSIISVLLD